MSGNFYPTLNFFPMNNKLVRFLLLVFTFSTFYCTTQKNKEESKNDDKIVFTIKNPSSHSRLSETIEVSPDIFMQKNKNVDWGKISFSAGKNLPFQLVDEDGNSTPENILLLASLKPNEEKQVTVNFSKENSSNTFTKRTYAEISHKIDGEWKERKYIGGTFKNVTDFTAPPQHTDHSYFIRYEGPGWESDKVGYRFYLDWRNAVDIFGKKTSDMVLQKVGQDGFDSYHEATDWGMDVLKVGGSLGIGSIGFWENGKATRIEKTSGLRCQILQNGTLQSKIRTTYSDWEINDKKLTLTSDLTIQGGSRLTRQDIAITESLPNLCSGIVKHENGTLIKKIPDENTSWGYIATYGKQSLADDNLGMVVFFHKDNFVEFTEDKESHVVVLNPSNNQLQYFFAAAWEQETNGVKTMDDFKKYLDSQIHKINAKVLLSL